MITTLPQPVLVLTLAIILDLAFGEPPTVVHPVAWMGTVISAVRKLAPKVGWIRPFIVGISFMLIGSASLALIGVLAVYSIGKLPHLWNVIAEAACLKTTFSVRALVSAGRSVQLALNSGDLLEARRLVSWHLVSRDTSSLSPPQVAAATIESLAENTSDSIIAPFIFFAVAGLPGALVYRFINTSDAILGYRDPEREWLGKFPARLDDLANLVPARMSALLLIIAGILMGCHPVRAISIWWRDSGTTTSPNAGHPMSAAAGALNVELEKVGMYRLGRGLRDPDSSDISRVTWLLLMCTFLTWIGLSGLLIALNGSVMNGTGP